jgi:hypothetical protein
MPFAELMNDNIELLKVDGTRVPGLKGSIQTNRIFMDAGKLIVDIGDLILRNTSTGARETYRVIEPGFYEAHHGIPANYQMKVHRLSAVDAASAIASVGGDEISAERREALFSQWEDHGLDIIKQDLGNGGFRFVGGPPSTRKLAREWVRIKEAEKTALVSPSIHVSGPNSRVNINSNDQSNNTVVTGGVFNEVRRALDGAALPVEERTILRTLVDELESAPDKTSFNARYQAFIAAAANHMTLLAPFLTPLAHMLGQLAS